MKNWSKSACIYITCIGKNPIWHKMLIPQKLHNYHTIKLRLVSTIKANQGIHFRVETLTDQQSASPAVSLVRNPNSRHRRFSVMTFQGNEMKSICILRVDKHEITKISNVLQCCWFMFCRVNWGYWRSMNQLYLFCWPFTSNSDKNLNCTFKTNLQFTIHWSSDLLVISNYKQFAFH